MKRALGLLAAFVLLVVGIESLHVVLAWWDAGRPSMGVELWLAFAALLVVGFAWWRHSVFTCARGRCVSPENEAPRRTSR